jgi:hypothetical protein
MKLCFVVWSQLEVNGISLLQMEGTKIMRGGMKW